MQNMHKTTHDRPLTGVHWPLHRGWCRGSGTKDDMSTSTGGTHRGAGWRTKAIIHVTARGFDSITDRTICSCSRGKEAEGYKCNNINTICRESKVTLTLGWHLPLCGSCQ